MNHVPKDVRFHIQNFSDLSDIANFSSVNSVSSKQPPIDCMNKIIETGRNHPVTGERAYFDFDADNYKVEQESPGPHKVKPIKGCPFTARYSSDEKKVEACSQICGKRWKEWFPTFIHLLASTVVKYRQHYIYGLYFFMKRDIDLNNPGMNFQKNAYALYQNGRNGRFVSTDWGRKKNYPIGNAGYQYSIDEKNESWLKDMNRIMDQLENAMTTLNDSIIMSIVFYNKPIWKSEGNLLPRLFKIPVDTNNPSKLVSELTMPQLPPQISDEEPPLKKSKQTMNTLD